MACYSPLKGYRGPAGTVVFNHRDGWVDRHVTVSCGQCIGCRLERSRQWAVRCMHEAQMHEHNSFITLTYNDANLPSDRSLCLDHWQKFAKRLRKKLATEAKAKREAAGPFRFFHCGEYGDLEGRPHYHAAIFGQDFSEDRKIWTVKRGNPLYTSQTLEALWGLGFCTIGELTFQSAAYVARYVMKKVTGKRAETHYDQVNTETGEITRLKPEYTTMSRGGRGGQGGIGKSWFDKYHEDVFPDDFVISNGQKARPPKFYDSQYELIDPEGLRSRKAERRKAGSKHASNNTPERLAVRETIQEARLTQLKREL